MAIRWNPGLPTCPPHRFEVPETVNITQNPCGEFGRCGVNKRGLKVSNFSADVYAELPRKRQGGRQTASPQPDIYQSQARTPLLQQLSQSSPSPSRRSSTRSSRPSVNSATFTRRRPVLPSQDILPVGYPVFSSALEDSTKHPIA